MIFLADHDKFFLKFHVQLTPHHVAGKKAEATTRGFTDICDITNREAKSLQQQAGKILQRPQKYIFCCANFGSAIALVLQQELKPFLYSSQE